MVFHGVSAKSLVDYHMERYGNICVSELKACRQALSEPIEVDRPIDVYFQRVEDSIHSVQDGKTLFAPAQIV